MTNLWEPILAILMALTNVAIKPNPGAPSGDAALTYAVPTADLVVHVDLKPTVIDNYPVLAKLAATPALQRDPMLRAQLDGAMLQLEGGRAMVKSLFGVDPATDLTSITGFVALRPAAGTTPDFLVVARGTLPAELPQRLTQQMPATAEVIDGRTAVVTPDGVMIGATRKGELLVGTRALVAPRLADAWQAPPRPRTSPWSQVATALDARPFALVASLPTTAGAASFASAEPVVRDVMTGHHAMIMSASATGLAWSFDARTPAMATRMQHAASALVAFLRAGHLVPRALLDLALAWAPSYAGTDPILDGLLRDRDKVAAVLAQLSGDGQFAAAIKRTGDRVTMTATGQRFSEVVPLAAVAVGVAVGALTVGQAVKDEAKASSAAPTPPMGKPTVAPTRPSPPTRPRTTPPGKPTSGGPRPTAPTR